MPKLILMHELGIRTLSGAVYVCLVIGSILLSPYALALLLLFVVAVGTFEMLRLQAVNSRIFRSLVVLWSVSCYLLAAMVALNVLSMRWLMLEMPLAMLPSLFALFSKHTNYQSFAASCYGALFFLVLPSVLMLSLYRRDWIGAYSGSKMIVLVFLLIWVNDSFAYLSGRLLGRHKLFERISPGKTIEGSLGGMVLTLVAVGIYCHYAEWISLPVAAGLVAIVVVFGTLGDLCESMLKRQAGVKDSGKLMPGHGGVLDRFDSVFFVMPFLFAYILLV